jgi:hypothetical protein
VMKKIKNIKNKTTINETDRDNGPEPTLCDF